MTQSEPRDSQRSKVYAAENVALWKHPQNTEFETFEQVETYMRWLIDRAPIQRRYKYELYARVDIRKGRGANAGIHIIAIPKKWYNKAIVCHELAHVIVTRHCKYRKLPMFAAHGREYCKVYLDLIQFGMGADAAEALKAEFRRTKVKFTAAKKRVVRQMTSAERQAMLDRLATARTARRTKKIKAQATALLAMIEEMKEE